MKTTLNKETGNTIFIWDFKQKKRKKREKKGKVCIEMDL